MTLAVCWVLFPLALLALAAGCGTALQWASGLRIGAPQAIALGMAVLTAGGYLLLSFDVTRPLTVPTMLVIGALGLARLAWLWRRRARDGGGEVGRALRRAAPWLLAAAGVFAVYAAPIVLSGKATFAGYIKLDDTATWLNLLDRGIGHGHSAAGLVPSSYQLTFSDYAGTSDYPLGWLLALGIARPLVGQDAAWLVQPYMATMAAVLSLVLYELSGGLLACTRARALSAFVGAQSALLVGYSLWGGIKEVALAWSIALLALVASGLGRTPGTLRSVLPMAFAVGAPLAILSFAAGAWVGPALVGVLGALLVAALRQRAWPRALPRAGVLALAAALLALPTIVGLSRFYASAKGLATGTSASDLGNLLHPLDAIQLAGIWLNGDFRVRPGPTNLNGVLVACALAGAAVAFAWALRRRQWGVPAYLAIALVGLAAVAFSSGAWVTAKALAAVSPAIPFAALVAAALLAQAKRLSAAVALGALVTLGVLASNVLAYRDVFLAPRDRLAELEHVGRLVRGAGPTLITEIEVYGSRHFLRAGDPVGASDLRPYIVPLRGGAALVKDGYADLDSFDLAGIVGYRSIVLRRSPTQSRPPGYYSRVWAGRYYELWQRPVSIAYRILTHLPLGDVGQRPHCGTAQLNGQSTSLGHCSTQAASVPACDQVRSLARLARADHGRLLAAEEPAAIVVPPESLALPSSWTSYPGGDLAVPERPGSARGSVSVPGGTYDVWIGGSFSRRVTVALDGAVVGSVANQLANRGQYIRLGTRALTPGNHGLELRAAGAGLAPGSGDLHQPFGSVILSPPRDTAAPLIAAAPAAAAKTLCGRTLDWIEVVAP